MAPVTFHGGPLHGLTVDADGPALVHGEGVYRFEGASLVYVLTGLTADEAVDEVHVRPRERRVTRR